MLESFIFLYILDIYDTININLFPFKIAGLGLLLVKHNRNFKSHVNKSGKIQFLDIKNYFQ